jgi:hypothetical protein
MNLAVWVERHGRRRPGGPALTDGGRVHAGWGAFAAQTAGAAAGLCDNFGLSGNRVAVVMRNRPEYLEALFAIWHAGLVAVPVNARLHRDEIAYILDHSESAVVVTDADHADDVESLVGTIPSLQAAVVAPGERWGRLTASSPAPLVARRPEDGAGRPAAHRRRRQLRRRRLPDAAGPVQGGPRPNVSRPHRPVRTAQALPARRFSPDQQLRQGPQAPAARPAPGRRGGRRVGLKPDPGPRPTRPPSESW